MKTPKMRIIPLFHFSPPDLRVILVNSKVENGADGQEENEEGEYGRGTVAN